MEPDSPLPTRCAACCESQGRLGVAPASSQTGLVTPGICRGKVLFPKPKLLIVRKQIWIQPPQWKMYKSKLCSIKKKNCNNTLYKIMNNNIRQSSECRNISNHLYLIPDSIAHKGIACQCLSFILLASICQHCGLFIFQMSFILTCNGFINYLKFLQKIKSEKQNHNKS